MNAAEVKLGTGSPFEVGSGAITPKIQPIVQVTRLGVVVNDQLHIRLSVFINLALQLINFLRTHRSMNAGIITGLILADEGSC